MAWLLLPKVPLWSYATKSRMEERAIKLQKYEQRNMVAVFLLLFPRPVENVWSLQSRAIGARQLARWLPNKNGNINAYRESKNTRSRPLITYVSALYGWAQVEVLLSFIIVRGHSLLRRSTYVFSLFCSCPSVKLNYLIFRVMKFF